jgi:threonine dehydrogenase-like Zn-dependent dehydrogenase
MIALRVRCSSAAVVLPALLFVQYLRTVAHFDGLVLLSEPNALKRSLAERWGAVAIDPSAGNLAEQVKEHSFGRGAELLIEASGSGPLFRDIPGLLRKQATVLLYGHWPLGSGAERDERRAIPRADARVAKRRVRRS